jgi:hypothetical protein
MFIKQPGPLFHRSEAGNVTFPPRTTGWYWTPEVKAMLAHVDHRSITITEGWEYIGWQSRPFSEFVPEYFDRRRAWKSAGVGAEKAIKLALNSLYGKMAQRVGWERTGGAPTWHQLEWAGWVTSFTRAALYDVLARIPWQDQIAVETDGIYTTATPESLGIDHSKALGEWEIKEYDELLYLQSGVYCLRAGGEWTSKYRGLNPGALSAQDMAEYLQTCKPGEPWEPITGPDTKFIGYQTALARSRKNHERFHDQHRHWVTIPDRKIDVGSVGKRVHRNCRTCKDQLTAYEYPHDLTIASAAFKDWQSTRHHIPWRDDDQEPEWRQAADDQRGLLR